MNGWLDSSSQAGDTVRGRNEGGWRRQRRRGGSAYIAYYSIDGTNWIQATSFTDTNTPRSIGLFGSNYNVSPAMASPITMSVNWFHSQ
jgi:hypothetical protein